MTDLYATDEALAAEAADVAAAYAFAYLGHEDWGAIETLALAIGLVLAALLCSGQLPA